MMHEEDGAMWYRVAFDREGSLQSCEEVEHVANNKRVVGYVYVQANDKAQAIAKAIAWYGRRKEVRRRADAKRDKARRENGICRNCPSRTCQDSVRFCARHLAESNAHKRRHEAGESERRRPVTPAAALAAHEKHLADHRMRLRLDVQLPAVLAKFDSLGPRRFREWCVAEIARRSGEEEPLAHAAE